MDLVTKETYMKNKNMLWVFLGLCIQSSCSMEQKIETQSLDLKIFKQEIDADIVDYFLVEECSPALSLKVTWFDTIEAVVHMGFWIFNIEDTEDIYPILRVKGFNDKAVVTKVPKLFGTAKQLIILNAFRVKNEYQSKSLGKQAFEQTEQALKGHFPQSAMIWLASPDSPSQQNDLMKFYNNRDGKILHKFEQTALYYKDLAVITVSEQAMKENKLYTFLHEIKK